MPNIQSPSKCEWIHPPDVILNSGVTYEVKFVGVTELPEPRKLVLIDETYHSTLFLQELRRLDYLKLQLVDLSISIAGIKILDRNKKVAIHNIPLKKVSYCVDDTNNKRLVAFIGKGEDHKHYCYGFESAHQAKEITLTIRQAFDQAYSEYTSPSYSQQSKQVDELNEKVKSLQVENQNLKLRNSQLEQSSTNLLPTKYSSTVRKIPEENKKCESSHMDLPSADTSKLDIFSDSILLHLPTTKKYLEKKQNCIKEINSPSQQKKKQAFLNQTIASVERAKVSLENLKEFVKKRNKQKSKTNSITNQGQCSKTDSPKTNCPVTTFDMVPKHKGYQCQTSENIINGVKMDNANQEVGETGLYQSIGDVIHTITSLMGDKNNFVENKTTNLNYKRKIETNDLIESNELSGNCSTSNDYINLQSLHNLPAFHKVPPIPPKPEHLNVESLDTFSIATTSGSTYSDTTDVSSILSSLEMFPQQSCSHDFFSSGAALHSSKAFLDGNMLNSRLNQPPVDQGYMQVKEITETVKGPQLVEVDSLYDKVFDLMEKVRHDDKKSNDVNQIRNLDTNRKSLYGDSKSLLDLLQRDNLFNPQQGSGKTYSREHVPNTRLVSREKGQSLYSLQETNSPTKDFPTIASRISPQIKHKLNLPCSPSTSFLKSALITFESDASLSLSKESLHRKTGLVSNPRSSKLNDKFEILD